MWRLTLTLLRGSGEVTNYTFATLDRWAAKTEKRAEAVLKQATNDTIVQASRTATGVSRGGRVRRGYVPRRDGILAGSLVSELHGGTSLSSRGENSYTMVVAGLDPGDTAEFYWTADYAPHLHYGTRRMAGWFWVDEAVQNWQRNVMRASARAKVQVR